MITVLAMTALVFSATSSPLLLLNISGFDNDSGQAVVAFFDQSSWSFPPDPDNAVLVERLNIEDQAVNTELDGLQPGTWAALVFHDANENGVFDREDEKAGFSGELSQSGPGNGPPSFDDFSFELGETPMSLILSVNELPAPGGGMGGPPSGGMGGRGGGGRPSMP